MFEMLLIHNKSWNHLTVCKQNSNKSNMYIYLNVCKQMTDITLLLLHSNIETI